MMNSFTYQRRYITSTAMRVFVVISIAFISTPSITTSSSRISNNNNNSNNGNNIGNNNNSEGRYSLGFVSSFQLNTVNTINTAKLRRTTNVVGLGGLNRNSENHSYSYSYSYGRNNKKQNQSLSVTSLSLQSGQVNYMGGSSRDESSKGLTTTTTTRLYNSSSNNNNDDGSSNNKKSIQNTITEETSQSQSQPQSMSESTSTNQKKEWNTSIFPSPVEQGKFIPQVYIQTIAAVIGIASGVSVSLFKLSIDTIRQICYDGFVNGNDLPLPLPFLSSLPSVQIPLFLVPILGSVAVAFLSYTGRFSPGLRGVVKEVDDDSLLAASTSTPTPTEGGVGGGGGGATVSGKKRDLFLNPFRKSLAAVVTLGTGNSLGPEGPGVEIGAAVSRFGMLLWPPDLIRNFKKMKQDMKDNKESGNDGTSFDVKNGYGIGGYNGNISNGESSNDENINLNFENSRTNEINGNDHKEDAERIARNRLLLACGAAAGVSSGFNAPLSGVFFALEVVQASLQPINLPSPMTSGSGKGNGSDSTAIQAVNPDIELQQQSLSSNQGSVTAILISSVLAALVARNILGNELALMLVTYDIVTPLIELPLYILLGMSCGVVSVIFSQTAKMFKNIFEGNMGPKPVREAFNALPARFLPIIGGLTCGVVGIFYPQILFFGYDTLNKLLEDNTLPTSLLLTLLAAKTFTTAICASSGLVGGTLAPSLFLGGMVGASFHNIACDSLAAFHLSETIATSSNLIFNLAGVPAYSMVGAASVLAAIFRAPLTASLLMFEITRNYEVLLPLLASAGVASLVSDILERKFEQEKS